MNKKWSSLFIAMVALTVSGCGTTCNLVGGLKDPENEPRIYGGVQRDLEGCKGNWDFHIPVASRDPRAILIIAPVILAEACLTCAGDTLTLPLTIYLQERRAALLNRRNEEEQREGLLSTAQAKDSQAIPEAGLPNTDDSAWSRFFQPAPPVTDQCQPDDDKVESVLHRGLFDSAKGPSSAPPASDHDNEKSKSERTRANRYGPAA